MINMERERMVKFDQRGAGLRERMVKNDHKVWGRQGLGGLRYPHQKLCIGAIRA